MKKKIVLVLTLALLVCCVCVPGILAKAYTIYDSPYVSFSPDAEGWTVEAGETDYVQYPKGTTVYTGISSSLRELEKGEHYYDIKRVGSVPIGKWVVNWRYSQCIHSSYPGDYYLGLDYGKAKCHEYYSSGWFAYCADCNEVISHMNVYMTKKAAKTIDYMECGVGLDYYHLCPYCNNLEQGCEVKEHMCKQISWNQYRVKYEPNTQGGAYGGYMRSTIHMYNNATEYNGKVVTPMTHLAKNNYTCDGYIFKGWNTKADGSGEYYADEATIYNLTHYDCNLDGAAGEIKLYAQWEKAQSTLQIDPDGGTYDGKKHITTVTQGYGTHYTVDDDKVTAPKGYTVSFETNGGTRVDDITGAMHFTKWIKVQPFESKIINNIYYFMASNGNTDTLRANYVLDSITLPETKKENCSFGGWYYDEAFTKPAGGVGAEITPTKDMTLYAQWVELTLYSEDDYEANGGKGAVDLWWTQPDDKNKAYKLYQSTDGEDWKQVNSEQDIGTSLQVSEEFTYSGSVQTYTIPYNGFYEITACGAQGDDYAGNSGGAGGMVSATFYLKAGDIIKYQVGGQGDTVTGGGQGTAGGNGGGATYVYKISDGVETLLLVAGGGGGASEYRDGGDGGVVTSYGDVGTIN